MLRGVRYRQRMTLGDHARRINDDRDAAERAQAEQRDALRQSVEMQLREIISPLAGEFADAARGGRWFGPRSWSVAFIYNMQTSGDGYANYGEGRATVFRDGSFTVEAPTAGYGVDDVVPSLVRGDFAAELARVLDAK
jgi:hypothetical protein